MEGTKVKISNLTDRQRTLLSQISYLGIDTEKLNKELGMNKEIKVKDLWKFLTNPDANKYGAPIKSIFEGAVGKERVGTDLDLVRELVDEGLGELAIKDVADKAYGFQAIAISDEDNNTAISYSGSDLNELEDWVHTNAVEFVTNDSKQAEYANEFFEKNKNTNGHNYLYGHSLGGNLVAHVYKDNYDNIENAFSINGTPINQDTLTPEQLEAFKDDKYDCYVIGGDCVSQLKPHDKYEENITYIKNNGELRGNSLAAHTVESALYDENGSFVTIMDKKEAYKDSGIINIEQEIPKVVSALGEIVRGFIEKAQLQKEEKEKEQPDNKNNKFLEFGKKIFNKIKEISNNISKMFSKKDQLLLTDGTDKDKIDEQVNKNIINHTPKVSFIDSLKMENYISETYTKEQAEYAQNFSNNPQKYISNDKISSDIKETKETSHEI